MTHPVFGVVFDWGGTLSLPREADRVAMWRRAAEVLDPDRTDDLVRLFCEQEAGFWRRVSASSGSGTLYQLAREVLATAGIRVAQPVLDDALEHYMRGWDVLVEHYSDAASSLARLRERGMRIGMLSNTHWPRAQHERFLRRDGLLHLIEVAVYSSECRWTKPDPHIFRHAAARLGAPRAEEVVYVGDRPIDDIEGAQRAGMRAVLMGDAISETVVPDAAAATLEEVADIVIAWADCESTPLRSSAAAERT